MYPHRIRLRGPWDVAAAGTTRRVMLPANWSAFGLEGVVGPVVCERRFGYPGRIDAHERVWLIGEGISAPVEICLTGQSLGIVTGDRFAFEVTARLGERNLARVAFDTGPERTGAWEDIALEVRATAFLADVSAAGNVLRGKIAGTADRPLEIYVLAGGRSCGYGQGKAGETFEVPCDAAGPWRVELVNVSTVWDVVECFA